MDFAQVYLDEVVQIAQRLDRSTIEAVAVTMANVRQRGGRLFVLGVGGSAANASHVVNDFRKLVDIETYSPTDNVAELTARVNDEGWATVFAAWLQTSRLSASDALLILSVGGGSRSRNVSPNLVGAIEYAKAVGATVLGIVGRDGGYTAQAADICVIVPTVSSERVTPHAEAFQAVIWHLLVSHPRLKRQPTKWESISDLRSAVFLDRDGVLNRAVIRDGKPYPPASVSELEIPDGVAEALSSLKERNFLLFVVTNQPDVARGAQRREVVEEIDRDLCAHLPIDGIFTCYHDDADQCDCRKPRPGLLLTAAAQFGIDLNQSFMVGDRWRDVDAGATAGCRTVWVDNGYNERPPSMAPDVKVSSLDEAVKWILSAVEATRR